MLTWFDVDSYQVIIIVIIIISNSDKFYDNFVSIKPFATFHNLFNLAVFFLTYLHQLSNVCWTCLCFIPILNLPVGLVAE